MSVRGRQVEVTYCLLSYITKIIGKQPNNTRVERETSSRYFSLKLNFEFLWSAVSERILPP